MTDFLLALELCHARRFREFVLLARLADRLTPVVPQASTIDLIRLSAAFAALGALNQPLFDSLARSLLTAWPSGDATECPAATSDIAVVARAFAAQRSRHVELFDRMASMMDVPSATPAEARSLLHSLAFLRLDVDLGGGHLWSLLEGRALEPGLDSLGPGPVSEVCHCLFLSRRAGARLGEVASLLDAAAGPVMAMDERSWSTGEGQALHRRLLLLRSALRYLYPAAYQDLPPKVKQTFRKAHRLELPAREPRPITSFVKKVSHLLTKLKIGNFCNAERGPFIFDVVERDRKLVYECNHFDRFYSGTTEKIAASCLQESIVKAMGYRVVQIPHWQWNKIKHKTQRTEYLRMSRYYAIKDRRELGPRDEAPEDVASNVFDHLGEYFFRKEAPGANWAWFQPRYDYRKRLRHAEVAP